jgi:hypothetical protein
MKRLVIVLIALGLSACATGSIKYKDGSQSSRPFKVEDLVKSDVDMVTEIHQQEVLTCLKELASNLYRLNPKELRKSGAKKLEVAVENVVVWPMEPKLGPEWEMRVRDAFRKEYSGDRVQAMIEGLLAMTMSAYNDKQEFFLLDSLEPQRLYNSARNYELVQKRLFALSGSSGRRVLMTDNSTEREFNKIIAIQDTLAKIVEDKTNRTIKNGVINVATFMFFPI